MPLLAVADSSNIMHICKGLLKHFNFDTDNKRNLKIETTIHEVDFDNGIWNIYYH
ncbi:hypothetical protein [Aquimarina sp. I32.4]|uniref:hypothetical protein n=1 Tax=Aquimarina sp. I32.4 TaxID=2053903 RepID=UPI001304D778|nr:hypothetical protein [Aquimarina sp. I32.4]